MIYYQDEDIIIRDVKESDIVDFFSYQLDRDIARYDVRPMPSGPKELLKACESYCDRFINQVFCKDEEKRRYKYFVFTDLQDRNIGYVNLFNMDQEKKQAEMGIVIGDKSMWNKGLGYRVSDVIVDYIFDTMEIDRLYIETLDINKGAQKLAIKLGFRYNGKVIDGDCEFVLMERFRDKTYSSMT